MYPHDVMMIYQLVTLINNNTIDAIDPLSELLRTIN